MPTIVENQAKDLSLSEKVAELVNQGAPKSVFDFHITSIDGEDIHLSRFSNKVLLFVNVATHCGYTENNYRGLQALHERYKDQGFEIIAFPSNEFGSQEPGTPAEIKALVRDKYKAGFVVAGKGRVNGAGAAPVWVFLKARFGIKAVPWNFQKFLVDRSGRPRFQYPPQTDPLAVEGDLRSLLGAAG